METIIPPPPSSRTARVLAFSARQRPLPIPVFEGSTPDLEAAERPTARPEAA